MKKILTAAALFVGLGSAANAATPGVVAATLSNCCAAAAACCDLAMACCG